MKVHIKLLVIWLIAIVVMAGCNNNKTVKPDNPVDTAWLMKLAIDNGDYDRFNSLFSDGRKGSVSKSEFEQLRDITTAGADYTNYELLTFGNGKMLLVRLSPANDDNEIEIEDVIIVPDEMKELFND